MNALQSAKSVLRSGDQYLRKLDRGHLSHTLGIPYRPVFNEQVDQQKLIADVADLYGLAPAVVQGFNNTYRGLHNQQRYTQILGELKTLSFEEAFIIFVTLNVVRPSSIVEIGTQYGKSTRKLIDMVGVLNLNSMIRCFDIANDVKYFTSSEARLIIDDITGAFRQKVLEQYHPQFIFLDAHPYALLKEVISETIQNLDQCTIAIHDCGWGLCNPQMKIPRDKPELISSSTGHWERHVLSEIFHVDDPLDPKLDDFRRDNLRLRIFTTPQGLAIITKRK